MNAATLHRDLLTYESGYLPYLDVRQMVHTVDAACREMASLKAGMQGLPQCAGVQERILELLSDSVHSAPRDWGAKIPPSS